MSFLAGLEQTSLSVWVREAPTLWAFPFILFLHTLGLGVAAGIGVAMNVWLLKFAGRHPTAPLERFFSVLWIGFTVALLSGVLLLVAYPTKALTDYVFYIKIALIVLALVQVRWLHRRLVVEASPARSLRPDGTTRACAGAAIALWAGAVLTGRLLAYTYEYLTAADRLMGT